MLCQYCEDFDYDRLIESQGYKHQPNWQALELSAARGCEVCSLVSSKSSPAGSFGDAYGYCSDETTKQVYCNLNLQTHGGIYWTYGAIRRAEVGVCVGYEDDLGSLIHTRPMFESVVSSGCGNMMRGWLDRCAREHRTCPNADLEHELPTRLLDVGTLQNAPFLVISNGRWGSWAALSHCWGRQLRFKTTKHNLDAHCESTGIGMDELPPIFRDAVNITRQLNIQYLWIDALCIVQDDAGAWEREAERMDYVYNNATVTIAAEASSDSSIGIVQSMKQSRTPKDIVAVSKCHSEAKNLRGKLCFGPQRLGASRDCLSTRAWTMQEETLSPRILRFARQQVLWNCAEADWKESHPEHSDPLFSGFTDKLHKSLKDFAKLDAGYEFIPKPQEKSQLLRFWYMNIVNNYICRDITFKTDRLIALQGIANKVRSRMGSIDYVAGIWYESGHELSADIHIGLLWSVPAGNTRNDGQQYIAPSWSWVQIDMRFSMSTNRHGLFYDWSLFERLTPLTNSIRITSYLVQPSTISSRATETTCKRWCLQVQSGFQGICSCKVNTSFLDGRPVNVHDNNHYSFYKISEKQNAGSFQLGEPESYACTKIGKQEGHLRYVYLQIARWDPLPCEDMRTPVVIALILEEIGSKLEVLYKRVGRALIAVDWSQMYLTWPKGHFSIL